MEWLQKPSKAQHAVAKTGEGEDIISNKIDSEVFITYIASKPDAITQINCRRVTYHVCGSGT
jgi:hypothetical protein